MKKKIAVLTSGGDAPGMNAAIRAIVKTARYKDIDVIGVKRGYTGLLKEEMFLLMNEHVAGIIHQGGTILKSSRCEAMREDAGITKAVQILRKHDIIGLVVIGGDGSFAGANKIGRAGIPVVGIPGTIDNDLAYTEYTIGFDTAVNTVVEAIGKIRDTSISHEKVTIVEVMGRNCGDIALYAGLASGAEHILLPESADDDVAQCFVQEEENQLPKVIVLSEGNMSAQELQKKILDRTGIESRITVLGFLQRGGSPSAFDRLLASRMGKAAVELLLDQKATGNGGNVIGIKNNQLFYMPICEAVSQEKAIDADLFDLYQTIR